MIMRNTTYGKPSAKIVYLSAAFSVILHIAHQYFFFFLSELSNHHFSVLDISLYFRNFQACIVHLLNMFKSVTSVFVACLLYSFDFLKCNLFWRNVYLAFCHSPCQKFVTRCRSSRRGKKKLTFLFLQFETIISAKLWSKMLGLLFKFKVSNPDVFI